MGWLRLVGSLKLQVSFAKEAYKRDDILQKRPIILRRLLIVATPYYVRQSVLWHLSRQSVFRHHARQSVFRHLRHDARQNVFQALSTVIFLKQISSKKISINLNKSVFLNYLLLWDKIINPPLRFFVNQCFFQTFERLCAKNKRQKTKTPPEISEFYLVS